MAFQYRVRPVEDWDKHANQSSSDYEGWIKDEYRTYRPVPNENCIRILPPSPLYDGSYSMEVWVHYGVGPDKASVICLYKMKKEPCPICEERAGFEAARDEDSARELKPTKRMLVFMINQKDREQGVLAWGMPQTLDRDIAKAARDRSAGVYRFVDHNEQGYDIYFDRTGDRLNTKYDGVQLASKPSSVPEKFVQFVEHNALPDALRWRTYEEVLRLHKGAGRGEAQKDPPFAMEEDHEPRRPPRAAERPAREESDAVNELRAKMVESAREQPPIDPQPTADRRQGMDQPQPPVDMPTEERARPIARPGGNGVAAPTSTNATDRAAALRAKFLNR